MWAMFFIIGGVWFWLLSAVAVVVLLWEVHEDRPVIGLVTIGMYFALIHLFGNASIPSAVSHSPWTVYLGIPIYVLSGITWATIKWALYVNRYALRYAKERCDFLQSRSKNPENITVKTIVPPELREEWKKYSRGKVKPRARDKKWEIITWMCYWPLSMLWTALDEPWRYIYEALSGMFQAISDKIYGRIGYDQDMTLQGESENETSSELSKHNVNGGSW
jgi:hypothetical protein